MKTIYSVYYSQNGGLAEDGPVLADFWHLENAISVCGKAGPDLMVIEREVCEKYVLANCED